ncbi:hypothetical protein, partial [Robbsia andropogonis]|uniref:hypothetical protein n=1 Tax=Robbsia andropogonis TaxID=28092 RepID=UPI001ABAE331
RAAVDRCRRIFPAARGAAVAERSRHFRLRQPWCCCVSLLSCLSGPTRVAIRLRLGMSDPRHIDGDDAILVSTLQTVNLFKPLLCVDQVGVDVENRDAKQAGLEAHIHADFQ